MLHTNLGIAVSCSGIKSTFQIVLICTTSCLVAANAIENQGFLKGDLIPLCRDLEQFDASDVLAIISVLHKNLA